MPITLRYEDEANCIDYLVNPKGPDHTDVVEIIINGKRYFRTNWYSSKNEYTYFYESQDQKKLILKTNIPFNQDPDFADVCNHHKLFSQTYPGLHHFDSYSLDVNDSEYHGYYSLLPHLGETTLLATLQTLTSSEELTSLLIAIGKELQRFHEKIGIIQGDLKPDHVRVNKKPDGTWEVFFIDFKLSAKIGEPAPEVYSFFSYEHYFPQTPPEKMLDMQGATSATVLAREDVYGFASLIELIAAHLNLLSANETITSFSSLPFEISQSLLNYCFYIKNLDPANRPSLADFMQTLHSHHSTMKKSIHFHCAANNFLALERIQIGSDVFEANGQSNTFSKDDRHIQVERSHYKNHQAFMQALKNMRMMQTIYPSTDYACHFDTQLGQIHHVLFLQPSYNGTPCDQQMLNKLSNSFKLNLFYSFLHELQRIHNLGIVHGCLSFSAVRFHTVPQSNQIICQLRWFHYAYFIQERTATKVAKLMPTWAPERTAAVSGIVKPAFNQDIYSVGLMLSTLNIPNSTLTALAKQATHQNCLQRPTLAVIIQCVSEALIALQAQAPVNNAAAAAASSTSSLMKRRFVATDYSNAQEKDSSSQVAPTVAVVAAAAHEQVEETVRKKIKITPSLK